VEGSRAARVTLGAMERISLMLAGAQLGITICSLLLLAVVEPALAHLMEGPLGALGLSGAVVHGISFVIALLLVGTAHVVLGEMVPKNVALAGPERAVLVLAPPLVLLVRVLRPAIAGLNAVANAILRLFGVTPKDEITSAFTRAEVAGLVDESRREGLLDPDEGRLLVGALSFEERDAAAVLLPLGVLETVGLAVTPHEVEEAAVRTGFSRFPVREGEALVGYLHLKDALEIEAVHRNRPIARSWVRPLPRVAVGDPLRLVLLTMQRSGAHLALATDAGRPVGVVALEDVLEELVGEVRDEAQRDQPGAM
jgi:CBS domain containing-hemolysin-like protein